jgi:hypothetical protein
MLRVWLILTSTTKQNSMCTYLTTSRSQIIIVTIPDTRFAFVKCNLDLSCKYTSVSSSLTDATTPVSAYDWKLPMGYFNTRSPTEIPLSSRWVELYSIPRLDKRICPAFFGTSQTVDKIRNYSYMRSHNVQNAAHLTAEKYRLISWMG